MKKEYLIKFWRLEQKVVRAHSPHSAAEFARLYDGKLETVEPVGGGDDELLTAIASCAFCLRPQLASINGPIGEKWHSVPDDLKEIPFDDVACPGCAIAKGIVSE